MSWGVPGATGAYFRGRQGPIFGSGVGVFEPQDTCGPETKVGTELWHIFVSFWEAIMSVIIYSSASSSE